MTSIEKRKGLEVDLGNSLEVPTYKSHMILAFLFFQKRTVARGPRTGLFSSQIESIDGRVKF